MKFLRVYFFFVRILLFLAIACLREREYLPKMAEIILFARFIFFRSAFVFGANRERYAIASETVYTPF